MEVDSEYSEASSITFEWTLRGLRNLFDSTKGDKKSKVTKSIRFGGNRWQILFYANAGQTKDGTEGSFVSLYLSCEPTPEEKEAALTDSGRWVREGVYKFSFELRNIGKSTLYNSKEAHNHSFTYKTANWGWAQFARRDSVYYQSLPVKAQDAFVIICVISSSPTTPPPQTPPKQPVPKALLDTVGALLDDPLYSDVQFIIPRRGQDIRRGRTIWASKRLLQRAEYFQTNLVFESNFIEGSSHTMDQTPRTTTRTLTAPSTPHMSLIMDEFEDSDDEDDEELLGSPSPSDRELNSPSRGEEFSILLTDSNAADSDVQDHEGGPQGIDIQPPTAEPVEDDLPSSPEPQRQEGPSPMMTIVVRDIAYTTYRAMLYYLYTDNVVFAPLSSSFLAPSHDSNMMPVDSIPSTPSESSNQLAAPTRIATHDPSACRAEWIQDWIRVNPSRPAPCSAKAMYRVADRLDLRELKERASQHIVKSLTVDNIAYEVFSPFAAAFEQIRKVEVDFFLSHWQEIRASNSMKNVWVQIRNGRHPGFEEVWPIIASSLEFKPSTPQVPSPAKGAEFSS